MPRVIHFEVHAGDPLRAMKFYSGLLDWEFMKWDGPQEYWLIKTGDTESPGIDGGLMRRRGPMAGNAVLAYVCTVDVPSVDDYALAATKAGGEVVVSKAAVPGVGWLVYCKDTEGNIFGLMQHDREAR